MYIAAVQTKPNDSNTEANINDHLRLIDLAAQKNVGLIIFPEMSLTGYHREWAHEYAFSENDSRLDIFRKKAVEHQMMMIIGAPIIINTELFIGAFIIDAGGNVSHYTKQFLHQGEEQFFSSSLKYNPLIKLGDETISLAICADITNPQHSENAYNNNTSLYLASIFYTPNGITEAHQQLSDYAKKYNMNILMANYQGMSYNLDAAGKSAFWDQKDKLVVSLENSEDELLIVKI
jgi:predicted amidohydrolase